MTEDELRGKFLTKLRLDKNLKQSDLAKMIGYSDKSISKWERGKCFPKDTETLIKLANIFDVSIDELLQGEYSDIEGKNAPHSNNKFFNFILKNRIILIIVFIIFILLIIGYYIFFIYIPTINNRKIYDKENILNINDKLDEIASDDIVENNDENDKYSNDFHSAASNRSGIKNNYDKLLDEGFTYQNFIYYKYINHDTKIEYYLINDSIKVYIYLNSDELIILNNSNECNEIVVEKYLVKKHEIEYINIDEIKNCNIEKCETYLDYAMYINYIKNLILY